MPFILNAFVPSPVSFSSFWRSRSASKSGFSCLYLVLRNLRRQRHPVLEQADDLVIGGIDLVADFFLSLAYLVLLILCICCRYQYFTPSPFNLQEKIFRNSAFVQSFFLFDCYFTLFFHISYYSAFRPFSCHFLSCIYPVFVLRWNTGKNKLLFTQQGNTCCFAA